MATLRSLTLGVFAIMSLFGSQSSARASDRGDGDAVRVKKDDKSTFGGEFRYGTRESLMTNDWINDFAGRNGHNTYGKDVVNKAKLEEVDENGDQYETSYSVSYLNDLLAQDDESGETANCQDDGCQVDASDLERRRLVVLGSDTRYEITGGPFSSSPYKHVGYINFVNGGSTWGCSGVLIGPRHVLTAGHCVHEGSGGGWYSISTFKFWPGRTSTYTPTQYTVTSMTTFSGWATSGDYDWDIGVLTLNADTGLGYPSWGYGGWSVGSYIYTKAYPCDKSSGSMWSSSGSIGVLTTYQYRTYTTDTYGCMSGGGWYSYPSGSPVVYAAHSGSGYDTSGTQYNRHSRLTASTFTSICDYVANNVC